MFYRSWKLAQINREKCEKISNATGAPNLLCNVLAAKGIDETAAAGFLNCNTPLADPFLLKGMEAAVARVQNGLAAGEKMVVFGDYDADGITATALLFSYLESAGADVFYMLPTREGDGYGLNKAAIDAMAKAGVSLLITVDNGISAVEEIAYAAQQGIDVVVTDHHLPSGALPQAVAVIDPLREDDSSPEKGLSGVGVAFKLACALEGCQPEELLEVYADFVAVGTVADLMPLCGENRAMVRTGLALLSEGPRPGLAVLLARLGFGEKEVTAENIAYIIAPRLNAAGRMGSAKAALLLLLTEDYEEAEALADELMEFNNERQATEQSIAATAIEKIESDAAYKTEPTLVVWGNDLHPGVVGIVAARIAGRYGKPTILISVKNGEGKGSGRSVGSFNLHGAISSCSDLLTRFGGHQQAAGLSINEDLLPLLRERINAFARQPQNKLEMEPLAIDAEVDIGTLTQEEVESLTMLEPCGHGNRAPLFLVRNAKIDGIYPAGEGRHTRLRIRSGGTFYAIHFSAPTALYQYAVGALVDIAVSLSVYNGANGSSITARIGDIRPAGITEEHVESAGYYRRFFTGVPLQQNQFAAICPTRQQLGALYREISKAGYSTEDLRPLFFALEGQSAGCVLAGLDILQELNLVEVEKETGRIAHSALQEKQNLEQSQILQVLRKGGHDDQH